LPFGDGKPLDIASLPQPIMYGLAVSPDEHELRFAQFDTRAVELMIVKRPFIN
jgi:hypothetical protein